MGMHVDTVVLASRRGRRSGNCLAVRALTRTLFGVVHGKVADEWRADVALVPSAMDAAATASTCSGAALATTSTKKTPPRQRETGGNDGRGGMPTDSVVLGLFFLF
jgi:hypothetical protein